MNNVNDLFVKPMQSGKREVAATFLREAVQKWDPFQGYTHLAAQVERALGRAAEGVECDRIADRMIQKMRKAGVIVHLGKGRWRWSPAPRQKEATHV